MWVFSIYRGDEKLNAELQFLKSSPCRELTGERKVQALSENRSFIENALDARE